MAETVEAATRVSLRDYIGGERRAAAPGEMYEQRNPMRPDEVVAEVPACDAADAGAAVAAAHEAFPAWAAAPAPQRGNLLVKVADVLESRVEQLARAMVSEMGKPLREARLEAARGAAILRFFGGEGYRPFGDLYQQSLSGNRVYTARRPLGVVGLITPWNFPCAIPLWKLSPALVYGNTVVLKLAHDGALTGLRIAECFADAGMPPGVLNVLTGSGSQVGGALVRDPRVRAISFTGSVPVGHSVRNEATSLGKRVQLELGGHNPLIVLGDAKLDAAVEAAYAGAFWSAGQKCTATRRIYVQDGVYDEFRGRFLDRIAQGRVGDPADPETEVGPIVKIYTQSLEAVHRFTNELQAGILHVNSQTAGAEVHVPFGGIKSSGWGPHEQGRAALEFYTELVTIYEDA